VRSGLNDLAEVAARAQAEGDLQIQLRNQLRRMSRVAFSY
jgi:hypothetical protein